MLDRSSSCSLLQPIIREGRANRLSLDHSMICYLRSSACRLAAAPLCVLDITACAGGAGTLLEVLLRAAVACRFGLLDGEIACRHQRSSLPPSLWHQREGDMQAEWQAGSRIGRAAAHHRDATTTRLSA
jgi:hypothetical protein